MAERCPTCGQAVELHTGSGGTSSYVKAAEVELSSLRFQLVEAREELDDLAPLAREALESRGREEDLERQLVEARSVLVRVESDINRRMLGDESIDAPFDEDLGEALRAIRDVLARLSSTESE